MAKTSFTVTHDVKAINGMIASIAKRGKQWQQDCHIAGICVALHAVKFRDVSLGTRLCEAMSYDGNSMRTWLIAFGPFKWTEVPVLGEDGKPLFNKDGSEKLKKGFKLDDEKHARFKAELDKDEKAFIKVRREESYVTLKPPIPFQGFDFDAIVLSAIARARKELKKHGDKPEELAKINLGHLKEVERILKGSNPAEGNAGIDPSVTEDDAIVEEVD